jgi:hypothetical protein
MKNRNQVQKNGSQRPIAAQAKTAHVQRCNAGAVVEAARDLPRGPSGIYCAKEFGLVALRECPLPRALQLCQTPGVAARYWRRHVETHPYFNAECECFAVLMLDTRRRVKGHQLISLGTKDTLLVDVGQVFRGAVLAGSAAIVVMHNHPCGDPAPSDADIKITRNLIVAGKIIQIDVLDHVIMGRAFRACRDGFISLRAQGFFSDPAGISESNSKGPGRAGTKRVNKTAVECVLDPELEAEVRLFNPKDRQELAAKFELWASQLRLSAGLLEGRTELSLAS